MALKTEFILTLQLLDGIGNKTIFKIVNQISTTIESVNELCSFWKTLKGKKFQNISDIDIINANSAARRIISESELNGIGLISFYDYEFPEILKNSIDESEKLDPPLLLYYRGDLSTLQKPGIAIIGTREPTANGIKAGEYFASEFAKRGYNIVSGLAIGCDSSAHRGALLSKGATTAFLANGLDWDSIYPKENLGLAKEIVENGGILLSEYSIGQSCGRYSLVARDRLQAGLSYATIVIQTGIIGGTMHAVNATLASKKPLFAVAYNSQHDISHEKVQGNNMLISTNKAHPLSSKNIENAISIIEQSRDNYKSTDQPTIF